MSNAANSLSHLEVTFASKKAGKREPVSFADLPLASQEAVIRYGAQRFINDKLGGADVTQEEAEKKFDEIMKQLKAGWVDRRGQGGGAQTLDPVEREARNLAKGRVKDALKAKGIALKDVSKDKLEEFIEQVLAKYGEELRKKAETIVKAQNTKLEIDDIDLDI